MEDKLVADYFVVAGLLENPVLLEEFSNEAVLKPDHKQDPIVDVCIIIKSLSEAIPSNYKCIEYTPTGFPADLNHGSIRAPEVYLCYRRGRDKPPITDIGVLYEGKERVKAGCEVIHTTPYGRPANVNNTASRTYVTYRRTDEVAACDTLAVMDICVILANKGEVPPHAFNQIGKNLNKGMVGSDVFLCYKKSMAKDKTIAYKPGLINRYPPLDNPAFPLPESVPMFCLPLGATIECWPAKSKKPEPVFSTFVLTGASGVKAYGAALMLYEEFPQEKLTDEQKKLLEIYDDDEYSEEKTVQATKCICLLARWPFFGPFKKYLKYLYRIALNGVHTVPMERHISHFMTEVPFPSPQRPRILVQLVNDVIPLCQQEETPLPQNGASYIKLLKSLGPENCLNLLLFALLEHKILIHSLRPDVLTSVAEALASIIFPFHWECPYIPLCPLGLSDVLNAPCPFIVGVDSRYFDLYDPPPDVTCVDLDTNTITPSEDKKGINYKMLPKKATKNLKTTLERLFEKLCSDPSQPGTPEEAELDLTAVDQYFNKHRKELVMETQIQEAFLRFTATILKGYDQYLLPIVQAPTIGTTDVSSLFDVSGFLKSRDKAYHKFFAQLMHTQLFSRFIEVRSFASEKDACLAFFDECSEKVDEHNLDVHLIELDDSRDSERTVFIYPPDPVGLPPGQEYRYNGFPHLKSELFLPQKTPSLVTPIKQPACPNSPMTKRTKQEIKSAQKIALRHAESPLSWAKCLMAHCYSLWFIHLPAYVKSVHSKTKALHVAFDVLVKMQNAKLQPPDEVCYRVLMQLCGLYHQPVLAVKVLFELKRNGVQPNAITYGFYNKVVLESKWPSSDTNAYLLWTKLRNVVLGVAQFKQGLRHRRLSMYSTSESDFDRISRTSTDSFVDEITSDKVDGAKTEFVNDLVSVESPNNEERTSTGGMSDRGYSSMTLADDGTGKRASMVIGSQESLDSLGKIANFKREGKETDRPKMLAKANKHTNKIHNLHKGKKTAKEMVKHLSITSIDSQMEELFRQKLGSIVRKSGGSFGSGSTLQASAVGSSAGLLMTSQTSLDESLFGQFGISHSLNFKADEVHHKRHRSWGEPGRHRALSLQEELQLNQLTGQAHSKPVKPFTKRIALLEDSDVHSNHLILPLVNGAVIDETGGALSSDAVSTSLDDSIDTDRTVCSEADISGIQPLSPADILDLDKLESIKPGSKVAGSSSTEYLAVLQGTGKSSSTEVDDAENIDSTSPKMQSPSHSLRTPVTANDPLGLFCSPPAVATSISARPDGKVPNSGIDLLMMSPQRILGKESIDMSCDSGVSSVAAVGDNINNLLIDVEMFGNTSTPVKQSNQRGSPLVSGDGGDQGRTASSRVGSLSSSGTSSPGSPTETWAPISQSQVQSLSLAGTTPKSSLPPPTAVTKALSTPGKHSRMVSRGESFRSALSSMAGFASKAITSKLTDFKHTITPVTPGSTTGSTTSLPKAHEMEKKLYEDEDDTKQGDRGSNQALKENASLSSSMDNITDTDGKTRQAGRYSVASYHSSSDQHIPLSDMEGQLKPPPAPLSGSTQSIPQALFNMAMEVDMCSLSKCTSCSSLLYDEEIMAGWSADDSNLNTSCQFCGKKLVPLLHIEVKDYRYMNRPLAMTPSQSSESMQSVQSMPNVLLHSSVTVPECKVTAPECKDANPCRAEPASTSSMLPEVRNKNKLGSAPTHPMTPVIKEEESKDDVKEAKLISFSPAHEPKPQGPELIVETSRAEIVFEDLPSVKSESDMKDSDDPSESVTDPLSEVPSASETVPEVFLGHQVNDNAQVSDAVASASSSDGKVQERKKSLVVEPITVPYLSPLVLRKEVENVVEQEGDMCLGKSEFVDEHPIIFWNLIWYFKRLDVPSHLPGLILTAKSTNLDAAPPASWSSADSRHVMICPVWDKVQLHEDHGVPMYAIWSNELQSSTGSALMNETHTFPRSLLQQVVSNIMTNNVTTPIRDIMSERRRLKRQGRGCFNSMYRDILFLSFASLGKENIDTDAFDREYRTAFSQLSPKEMAQLFPYDRPPKKIVVSCRQRFNELELCT